jgi:hypothetical protein
VRPSRAARCGVGLTQDAVMHGREEALTSPAALHARVVLPAALRFAHANSSVAPIRACGPIRQAVVLARGPSGGAGESPAVPPCTGHGGIALLREHVVQAFGGCLARRDRRRVVGLRSVARLCRAPRDRERRSETEPRHHDLHPTIAHWLRGRDTVEHDLYRPRGARRSAV